MMHSSKRLCRLLGVANRSPTSRALATQRHAEGVTVKETEHKLTFVKSLDEIDLGRPTLPPKFVRALELENNKGLKVMAMAEGGNMCGLTIGGQPYGDYVWDNKEGACYYGPNSNAFPLKRGLILHGGVRFAAVTAEHGLYYDIEWDMTTGGSEDGYEKSIILQIQDTQASRDRAADRDGQVKDNVGFSSGQFCVGDGSAEGELSKYPVTDLIYTYTITVRKDEDFVRLNMKVANPTDKTAHAEAWLPMTFPINKESYVLSEQNMRWRRDTWCFEDLANMVDCKSQDYEQFHRPLDWPSSGIFYDFPCKDGYFHGVTTANPGQGIVYVAPTTTPHYTKMWSWGNKEKFDRDAELAKQPPLGAGRPYSEYYEPWSSGSNFAFFQTRQFEPKTAYSWEVALFPIQGGLHGDQGKMCDYVRNEIDKRQIPQTLSGVKVEKI